jgi:hypothetical protein
MGTEFTFYDYVAEDGTNVIREWLHAQGKKVTADYTTKILHLEATNKGSWARKVVDTLGGDCKELFEILGQRGKVKLRLLGFHDPGDGEKAVTLVLGFEKTSKLAKKYPCADALKRREQTLVNTKKHRVLHDIRPPPTNPGQP